MARWSIVATVKAPTEQVLAFVAHHLPLGPSCIRLYFDDPADPAQAEVKPIAGVETVACDDAHWRGLHMARPDRHQERQSFNAQAAYRRAEEDWLLHIDVDEFLLPERPVADVLAAVPRRRPILRVAPFEALHDPAMADDIFTARHFRHALPGPAHADDRAAVFGPYAPLLPAGVLSHAIGKCFFRTGITDLRPWLHGARLNGERVPQGPASPDMALLHFHAQDPVRWRAQLPFRLGRGAYVLKPELQAWLSCASPAEVEDFYLRVQTATPEALATLRASGLLKETTLNLRNAIASLKDRTHMTQTTSQPTLADLMAALPHVLSAPKDDAAIQQLCFRPAFNQREFPERLTLTRAAGVPGERFTSAPWLKLPDGSGDPRIQVSILPARVLDLVWRDRVGTPHPGDTIIADLDMTEANLPAGTLLRAGTAVLRVSDVFNDGCVKWKVRYGNDAKAWITAPGHPALRLRGILCSVEQDGEMSVGDRLRKLG